MATLETPIITKTTEVGGGGTPGPNTVQILASPGVSQAYRVLGIAFAVEGSPAGVLNRLIVQDSTGIAFYSGAASSGTSVPPLMFPAPGVLCATNAALQALISPSVANMAFIVTVYYQLEPGP